MLSQDADTGVNSDLIFHPRTNDWRLRIEQRYSLTLHVRTHEGTVGVVVFKERNQGSCNGHNLFWRNVHEVNTFRRNRKDFVLIAAGDVGIHKMVVFGQRFVGLGNNIVIFFVSGQIDDFIGNTLIDFIDLAIWGLNETIPVDHAIGSQGTDEPDVRTFRGLNWAHTAIMGRMDVTDFIAGTFTGKTARSQGGQTAFMRQFGKRVVLVHELGQLAAAEKFLHSRYDRTNVDKGLRGDDVSILDGHAFTDDTFHTGQSNAELVLQEFANAADTTVAQMVDIILAFHAINDIQEIAKGSNDISRRDGAYGRFNILRYNHAFCMFLELDIDDGIALIGKDTALFDGIDFGIANLRPCRKDHGTFRAIGVFSAQVFSKGLAMKTMTPAQFLIDFVTTDICQIIAAIVGEKVIDELFSVFKVSRFTRTQLPIDFQKGIIFIFRCVLGKGSNQVRMLTKDADDIIICRQTHDTQEGRSRQFARPVHTGINDAVKVGLIFNPGPAVRDDCGPVEELTHWIHVLGIIDARAADKLTDNDTFCPIDDEGPRIGHKGEIAHKDSRFLDFARIFIKQTDVYVQRSRIGCIFFLASFDIILRIADGKILETQFQAVCSILDRRYVLERVMKSFPDEPLIGFSLQVNQMRHLQDFFDSGIAVPFTVAIMNRLEQHMGSHSFTSCRFFNTKKQGPQSK